MRRFLVGFVTVFVVAALTWFAVGTFMSPSSTEAVGEPASPSGKTYDTWVSQSFAAPPFPPFLDCFKFNADGSFETAQLGPGGSWSLSFGGTPFAIWRATHPAGGANLLFIGTSYDGSTIGVADVAGGIGIGTVFGDTFGVEGVADAGCQLGVGAAGGNPYSSE